MTMRSLSISELKAKLSAQLRYVKRGKRVLVTDRGRPVAMLVPVEEPSADGLARLEAQGLVRRGAGRVPTAVLRAERPEDREASVRSAVARERETGW